jgi:anti-sigma regulatory factor (Ser/Thr protein kinase)
VDETTIQLTIPAAPEFLRLARLTAADVGSRAGLTFEEIDDLRIAVDELCFAVVEGAGSAVLDLRFLLRDIEVVVEGQCAVGSGVPPVKPSDLATTIVAAVVDEFSVDSVDSTRRFSLRKRVGPRS